MFFNPERKPPRNDLFISMLSNLVMNEDIPQQLENPTDIIHTNDFVRQVLNLLQDEFIAEISLDENYVISLIFSNKEKFKIRIIKE